MLIITLRQTMFCLVWSILTFPSLSIFIKFKRLIKLMGIEDKKAPLSKDFILLKFFYSDRGFYN